MSANKSNVLNTQGKLEGQWWNKLRRKLANCVASELDVHPRRPPQARVAGYRDFTWSCGAISTVPDWRLPLGK